MKKILIIFLLILVSFPIMTKAVVTNSTEDISIGVYIFTNEEADVIKEKEWFESLKLDKKKIFVNVIDTKNELYTKFKETFSIKKDKLPVTVIGSTYYKGYNESIKKKLTKVIEAYEEKDYCDLILKLKNGEDTKECIKINKNIYNPIDIMPIVIGSGLVVLITGLYFIKIRKK